jgi:hypothetical protein
MLMGYASHNIGIGMAWVLVLYEMPTVRAGFLFSAAVRPAFESTKNEELLMGT